MSLVLSTGTNLGNRKDNLALAKAELEKYFEIIECSRVYESEAVDYLDQPKFLNQILVFKCPDKEPLEVMKFILEIESSLGRSRTIDKGPRTIDIDMLFWNELVMNNPILHLPHPRLFERSFIVMPLMELNVFKFLKNHFSFQKTFTNHAQPY